MALIEDFNKLAKDFFYHGNTTSSNTSKYEDDNEIEQISDDEIEVLMDEEPLIIEIEEPLGGIIDFADENEINQSSRISDEDSYNPDLNDDVYLS